MNRLFHTCAAVVCQRCNTEPTENIERAVILNPAAGQREREAWPRRVRHTVEEGSEISGETRPFTYKSKRLTLPDEFYKYLYFHVSVVHL